MLTPPEACLAYARAVIDLSLASFLRFWAVAASRNSSRAPRGPRGREPGYDHARIAAHLTDIPVLGGHMELRHRRVALDRSAIGMKPKCRLLI